MRLREFSEIAAGHAFRGRVIHKPGGRFCLLLPRNITAGGAIVLGDEDPLRTELDVADSLLPGDVLVVTRGRFAAAVFQEPGPGPWIVPSSIIVLRIGNPSVMPEYVALYINSENGQRLFRRLQETTTVPFVSKSNLAQVSIPIPPLERQQALVELGDSSRTYARLAARKIELHRQILDHELAEAERSFE